MNFDIYQFTSYRELLKGYVGSQKNAWGLWAKIAKAANCKPSYLSQAIQGKTYLTHEHVMGISRYLEFSEAETDYFLLLLGLARAGTKQLKEHFNNKIERVLRDRENITKRLQKPRLEVGERETLYYSAWYWSAMHILVSIPEFRTTVAIAQRLHLPIEFVKESLEQLKFHGIIEQDGHQWKLAVQDVHIPKDSIMVGMHHFNWRQKAVSDALMSNSTGVHYTAVYSMSRKDYQHLKEKMLDLIEHSRKVVGPSKEEELVAFCCDLFRV